MSAPISIRTATTEDIKAVLDLWNLMMDEHQDFDSRVRLAPGAAAGYSAYIGYHLNNDDSRLLVAESGGAEGPPRVVGFVLASINRNLPMFLPERYGYLSDLAIEPGSRRQGIGRALCDRLRAWLVERGIDSIQLQVYTRNSGAAAFWKTMGFDSYYDRMWMSI